MNLNDIEIKEDSPEKLAAVNGKPTKNYLFASEFNAIVEKIKEHDLSVNKDSILVVGDDAKDGNVYTYNNYVWRINGTTYNNTGNPIEITINAVTAGYKRKDITYFDTNNNIVKLQGDETNGEIVESPALPPNAIIFRTYDVDDSGINVSDPIYGDDYVKKIYSGVYAFSGSGVDAVIPFNPEGKTEVRLTNSGLVSIAGFTNENLSGTDQRPFQGQIFTIRNLTGNSVILKHESLEALFSCYLNENTNLVIPNKGVITLIFDNAGMFEKFKSWVNSNGSNLYNPNGYLIPEFYTHNWTQAGEHDFNLVHPTNAGNVRTRMEAPALGSTYYIKFYFKEPILISEIYYCNGSAIIADGSIEQFKLFGSTSVKSDNTFPLKLHDSTVGNAVMQVSNGTTDYFEPFKKVTLANPLTVASLKFEAHTIYAGGSTRPRIQKILFK